MGISTTNPQEEQIKVFDHNPWSGSDSRRVCLGLGLPVQSGDLRVAVLAPASGRRVLPEEKRRRWRRSSRERRPMRRRYLLRDAFLHVARVPPPSPVKSCDPKHASGQDATQGYVKLAQPRQTRNIDMASLNSPAHPGRESSPFPLFKPWTLTGPPLFFLFLRGKNKHPFCAHKLVMQPGEGNNQATACPCPNGSGSISFPTGVTCHSTQAWEMLASQDATELSAANGIPEWESWIHAPLVNFVGGGCLL